MSLPDEASIERLALRVLDQSLPKEKWTHASHFALALWLLRYRGDLAAPDQIRRVITRYNEATGTANTDSAGYHHTITLASMRGAADQLRRLPPGGTLADALAALMASRLGRSDWLLDYWRRGTLFSAAARRDWVDPDLQPLPF